MKTIMETIELHKNIFKGSTRVVVISIPRIN